MLRCAFAGDGGRGAVVSALAFAAAAGNTSRSAVASTVSRERRIRSGVIVFVFVVVVALPVAVAGAGGENGMCIFISALRYDREKRSGIDACIDTLLPFSQTGGRFTTPPVCFCAQAVIGWRDACADWLKVGFALLLILLNCEWSVSAVKEKACESKSQQQPTTL